MWFNIRVGSFSLRYTALNPIDRDFPYCDKDGKLLKKIAGKRDGNEIHKRI